MPQGVGKAIACDRREDAERRISHAAEGKCELVARPTSAAAGGFLSII
jgi:hypothetical protein